MWSMCEFHESTCNGFGDIWWTDNPIYFISIDNYVVGPMARPGAHGLGPGLGLKYDNCVAGRPRPGHTSCLPGRARAS